MSNTTSESERDRFDTDGDLQSVVVTYDGSPDRQTLYPAAATESERLTHWLTADSAAFENLDEMR